MRNGRALLRLQSRKQVSRHALYRRDHDLSRRIGEHKSGIVPGFTKKYGVTRLVYFEGYASILEARAREHSVKRWRRDWKFSLIEAANPDWRDLTPSLAML